MRRSLPNQLVKVHFIGAVVRVANHMHLRIVHGLHIGLGILRLGARINAHIVQAGNAVVKGTGKGFIQVHGTVEVQDVQFTSEKDLDPHDFPGQAPIGAEIMLAGRSFHGRAMVGNAQQCQAHVAGSLHHFVNGIISVSAGNGMGVNVQYVKHGSLPPPAIPDTSLLPDRAYRFQSCRSQSQEPASAVPCC